MSSVTLVTKQKPEAVALAQQLSTALAQRGIRTDGDSEKANLIVVVGGDGTFLHAAQVHGDRGVPLLGINAGDLGFLTEFSVAEGERAVIDALENRLPTESRMRMCVTLSDGQKQSALNDVVLSQRGIARLLDIEAWLGPQRIAEYKADGVILATPTGSTAYNLSAGGPILNPSLEAMVLTPICPHTFANRPLVLPATSHVRLRVTERTEHAMVTIDGQREFELSRNAWIEVQAHEHPLRYVRNPARSYFDLLRAKLTWGVRES